MQESRSPHQSKVCTRCKVPKPTDEFSTAKKSKDGLQSWCRECCAEYRKTATPPSRTAEHRRKWLDGYRANNPDVFRDQSYRSKYGITINDYDRMLAQQGGRCAICATDKPDGGRFCIDHCHDTGDVRALLCRCCNTGIGNLRDDPKIVEAALRYLRAFKGVEQ